MDNFSNLKFHNRKNMDISLRFGFVGVGLMGGRVVDTIARLSGPGGKQLYPGLAININQGDLASLKNVSNKLLLKSSYKAAGRNPEVGYEALSQNEAEVKKAIADLTFQSNFIWFVAGLGGGTGTGAILQLIEWATDLSSIGVDFGIIVSIPREIDGYQENRNALLVLEQLNEVAAARAFPIIVVDNEVLFNRYLEKRKQEALNMDWTEHSNMEIAGLLHQINIITTHPPYASKHFDGEEFRLVLKAGGCLQFAKTIIDLKEFRDELRVKNVLEQSMTEGLASQGYTLSDSCMMGIAVYASFAHAKDAFDIANVQVLENAIRDICPKAEVRWGQYVDYNSSVPKVEIYSVIAGLGLPSRVEQMPALLKKLQPAAQAKRLQLELDIEDKPKPVKQQPLITNPFKKASTNLQIGIIVNGSGQGHKERLKLVNKDLGQEKEVPAWLRRG